MNDLRTKLGLAGIHPTIIGLGVTLYILIALILIVGLVVLIIGTIALPFDVSKSPKELRTDFLFSVLRLAGLTTVLGAVIALPFTIVRLGLTTQQTKTARDSLFNEKINAATQGLYARRQVTKAVAPGGSYKLHQDFWQDDIVQRCAAIDRLEGLAEENRDDVPRIARLLSVYVRELSKEVPAKTPPDQASPEELRNWATDLPKLRSDMEKAAQTLGRMNRLVEEPLQNGEIDLRGANLQRADLNGLHFQNALMSETQLQAAELGGAQLQEANLVGAQLQGADLRGALLLKANLQNAGLQSANLRGALLPEANLWAAQLQGADLSGTQLLQADLRGAQLQEANLQNAILQRANLRDALLLKANLRVALLQGAALWQAQLQGAELWHAQLQGADLLQAQLQGADLQHAQLQGVDLERTRFDSSTKLARAILLGARVKRVDFTTVPQIMEHLDNIFGDASVKLPNGIDPDHKDWPAHWPMEKLNWNGFKTKWREWQNTLPEGWDKDIPTD